MGRIGRYCSEELLTISGTLVFTNTPCATLLFNVYPILQSPLRESFEFDIRGSSQLVVHSDKEHPLYLADVGEIKSSLSSHTLAECVTQLLVNLSVHAFLAQVEHPNARLVLQGHIYVSRSVGGLDKLRVEMTRLVSKLSTSVLTLPHDAVVRFKMDLINGHK